MIGRRGVLFAAAAPPLGMATQPSPGPTTGLNRRALRHGRFYGAALDEHTVRADAEAMARVPVECGYVVSETAFKWAALQPYAEVFAFDRAELLAGYAGRHALRLRGHTLLWHQANPPWLEPSLTSVNAEKILSGHIHTVVRHFRGRVAQWDVVNEVVDPHERQPLGLRNTIWTRALGGRCLDIAFHACAEADPSALRVLNESGLDYATEEDERKREVVLSLLTSLRARGVPVQALGVQAHLQAGAAPLDQTAMARFCDAVAGLGLKIVITEMDVRDNRLPAEVAVRDAAVAAHGRAYLDAMLSRPNVLGVVTWGLSDRHSWLNGAAPRADHLPQRALPLDGDLRRKPLWAAMAAAFDTAT